MKSDTTCPASQIAGVSLVFQGRRGRKRYEDLTIADNFMFTKVMQNTDFCRELLHILLGIPADAKITRPETESVIRFSPDSKSVFLDIHTSDESTDYDIEMQQKDTLDLPKRARYYQSIFDADSLEPGMAYRDLRQNVVLFICMTDIFGLGLPVYTFMNTCQEEKGLLLGDETKKVFYIAENYAKLKGEEARSFMELVETGKASSQYTERVAQIVEKYRKFPKYKREYMDLMQTELYYAGREEDARQLGIEEGIEQGTLQTKIETARNLLNMKILSPEQIAQSTGLTLEQVKTLESQSCSS